MMSRRLEIQLTLRQFNEDYNFNSLCVNAVQLNAIFFNSHFRYLRGYFELSRRTWEQFAANKKRKWLKNSHSQDVQRKVPAKHMNEFHSLSVIRKLSGRRNIFKNFPRLKD